jgi:hypothetical protein
MLSLTLFGFSEHHFKSCPARAMKGSRRSRFSLILWGCPQPSSARLDIFLYTPPSRAKRAAVGQASFYLSLARLDIFLYTPPSRANRVAVVRALNEIATWGGEKA